MLVLGLTNLFGVPGGIPSFNRLLCQAAVEWLGSRSPLLVLALMDAAGATAEQAVIGPGRYVPCGGDRRRFSALVLAQSWRRPGLCLGHVNLAPLGWLAGLSGRGFGVVAHGTEVWQPMPLARRLALRRARAVACVSQHTAQSVQRVQGVDPARCVRVINALDPARFAPPSQESSPDEVADPRENNRLQILSLTRLKSGEPKGVDLMLRALVDLPQVDYRVAGEGDALPGLKALAERLGVQDRVRFLGRVSDAERAAELRACDVFALPSSGEGFGIVYLEAMAYGKPCLAALAGGAPEVVLDQVTGLCVQPEVPALVRALRVLSSDAALRQRLGEAGLQRVLDHFCYQHFREHAFRFFGAL